MALVDGLSFTQNSDIETGVITDTTDYSVGGNPARSATANYLLWSKTNSSGTRTFDNPDPGNVLSTLVYTVNTTKDGYYEAILIRVTPYDPDENYVEQQQAGNVITQYASIVYDSSSVYKCINPITGVAPSDPSGSTYWEVVEDLSTLLDNPNVDVYIKPIYIKIRSMECIADKFKSCGCGCAGDLDKIRQPLTLRYELVGADSQFANGNYTEMEKIIRDIEQNCSSC